jgi:SPP1 family predicted phage head-tail adaptor
MISSRSLNKRIELWNATATADGYGGSTIVETMVTKMWAKVETLNPGKNYNLDSFGLESNNRSLLITVRKRNDLFYNIENMFVVYRDKKYVVATSPVNIQFNDSIVQFVITEQQ